MAEEDFGQTTVVDLDVNYDPGQWLELPPLWEKEAWSNIEEWSSECSTAVWQFHTEDSRENEIEYLAGTLLQFAHMMAPEDFNVRVLLHMRDPLSMPLPVVIVATSSSDSRCDEALRSLVLAEDADAVDPPVVQSVDMKSLGEGLRSFRYLSQDDDATVLAAVRYAWRSVDSHADVLLRTATDDVGHLLQALSDIEVLAHTIEVRSRLVDGSAEARQRLH